MSTTSETWTYNAALRDHLLASFSGKIKPVPVSPIYRLGLLLVTVAMVLLPLIYIGLIVLAGVGVYYHATENLGLFETISSAKMAAIAYVGPLFMGVVLVFFMIKPLLAGRGRAREPRSLSAKNEPLLFRFVEEICHRVGASVPTRIDVDCEVNASASFRRGLFSFFSQDLVLTIGLPLVQGLTVQQLAGVLAHEFGHFAQGAGMRLTYIIRSINHWFMRVVYERDSWDESLQKSASSDYGVFVVMVWGAMFFVWLTRKILWSLMWVGNALSSFMLRQMEFDADRYEARLVGGQVFESTCRELMRLSVAHQRTMSDLNTTWHDGRLIDDLPALVGVHRRNLGDEIVQALDRHISESKTGVFDTHPADQDRIRSAWQESSIPVFQSDLPASLLFRDFSQLSCRVSSDLYEAALGEEAKTTERQSAEQVLERQQQSDAEEQARTRFFCGAVHYYRVLSVPAGPVFEPPDVGGLLQRMVVCHQRLKGGWRRYLKACEAYEESHVAYAHALQAETILDAKMSFDPETFHLSGKDQAAVTEKFVAAKRGMEQMAERMAFYETLASERLELALSMVALPGMAERTPELGPMFDELPRLLKAIRSLGEAFPQIEELRLEWIVFQTLAGQLAQNEGHTPLQQNLVQSTGRAVEILQHLHDQWADVEFPLDRGDREQLTLQRYLVPAVPDPDDVGGAYEALQQAENGVIEIYFRVMARLALIGERLENELGLAPFDLEPAAAPDDHSPATI